MESNIGEIIKNSLDSIRQLCDANTIIGEPINTAGGTVVIPVSKISMGFASGGVDFNGKEKAPGGDSSKPDGKPSGNGKSKNFGGGGGTGVTISPIAFLIIDAEGRVDMLNISAQNGQNNIVDSLSDLLERSPDIIGRFKEIFGSKGEDDGREEDILGDEGRPE